MLLPQSPQCCSPVSPLMLILFAYVFLSILVKMSYDIIGCVHCSVVSSALRFIFKPPLFVRAHFWVFPSLILVYICVFWFPLCLRVWTPQLWLFQGVSLPSLKGYCLAPIVITFCGDFICSDFYTKLIFPELIEERLCSDWLFLTHRASSFIVFLACLSCLEMASPRAQAVLELAV